MSQSGFQYQNRANSTGNTGNPPPAPAIPELKNSTGEAGSATTAINYAGVGKRAMASFLDGIIIGVATFAVSAPFSYGPLIISELTNNSQSADLTQILNLIGMALTWIVSIAYPVYFIGKKGATPGKMILKIKVVKKNSPDTEIGFGGAFVRETVGKLISGVVLGLGYLWILWDKEKQGWHDKIAQTVVIEVNKN